jgi:outer membrane assembly lipoprotein YfiO
MDFDELEKCKKDCLEAGDKKAAIKYLDRMAQIKTDLEDLKGIMLELAQLLFEIEDYKRASEMYNKFVLLYPGCDEVELSMYKAIFSMSKLMLDAEHDQTKTVETKELAQEFLDRSSFTHHRKEVEAIVAQCEERLLESEINIFNFYIKRGNFVAAQTRLANIKEAYGAKTILPDIQTKLACLEQDYAHATINLKNEPVVVAAQDKDEKIPTSEPKVA